MMAAGGRVQMTGIQRPVLASDAWMHEQQVRAELEAEAWRRLRADLAVPQPAAAAAPVEAADPHNSGSTILKAVVRFALASFAAYLAYIAAADSRVGEFESWLAIGATFMVALALSMFGPFRRFVHTLAETTRWMLLVGVGFGAVWVMTHYAA
jgi:hypothetical protein